MYRGNTYFGEDCSPVC